MTGYIYLGLNAYRRPQLSEINVQVSRHTSPRQVWRDICTFAGSDRSTLTLLGACEAS